MDLDNLQKAWQSQDRSETTLNEEEAFRMVLQKSRKFDRSVFWRDVRESAVALGLAAFFVWGAHKFAAHSWPWYAAAACDLWVAAFLIADRRVQRDPAPGSSTKECIGQAVRSVDHQIRLLRNVAWWYLLPCALSILLVLGEMAAQIPRDMWMQCYMPFLVTAAGSMILLPGVYWLNQYAVRKTLVPLKEEFEKALTDLEIDAQED
jgi:hypothetical protein